MKLIFFACSLLLFIAGACQTPRPSVCLKGNILLSSFQDYKLYLQDHGEDMLIQPDSIEGKFMLEIACDSAHIAILTGIFGSDENKWYFIQPLFLTPGKEISMQLQTGERGMKVTFASKDNNNNALKAYQDYYLTHSKELWINTPSPSQAKEFLMGFIQKARELTDKLRPAPEVARYLATFGYLEYLKGIGHCNYIYRQQNEQERLQGLEETVAPPDQMLDDPIALLFKNDIPNIIIDYLKKEVIDPEGQLELLRQKFTQPQIVRLITENIIQHYLVSYPYSRDFEEGLARLKKMCTFLPEKGEEFIHQFQSKRYCIEGADLPAVTLEDPDGKQYKLSDFKGKPLYIDLWASWCVPCCKEISHLQKLERQVANKQLEFISISIDENKKDWKARMQQLHMEGRQYIVVGNELANMLNISSIPHFLIYNKAGNLIQYEAPRPSAGKPLQEMLEKLK